MNPNRIVTFNIIQVGKKFKTTSNITYQKTSTKKAKPIYDSSDNAIVNGTETVAFYDNKIKLVLV